VGISALFPSVFYIAGLVTGRIASPQKTMPLIHRGSFLEQVEPDVRLFITRKYCIRMAEGFITINAAS